MKTYKTIQETPKGVLRDTRYLVDVANLIRINDVSVPTGSLAREFLSLAEFHYNPLEPELENIEDSAFYAFDNRSNAIQFTDIVRRRFPKHPVIGTRVFYRELEGLVRVNLSPRDEAILSDYNLISDGCNFY